MWGWWGWYAGFSHGFHHRFLLRLVTGGIPKTLIFVGMKKMQSRMDMNGWYLGVPLHFWKASFRAACNSLVTGWHLFLGVIKISFRLVHLSDVEATNSGHHIQQGQAEDTWDPVSFSYHAWNQTIHAGYIYHRLMTGPGVFLITVGGVRVWHGAFPWLKVPWKLWHCLAGYTTIGNLDNPLILRRNIGWMRVNPPNISNIV